MRVKKYKKWSSDEEKVLIRLRNEGNTIPEIAQIMKRSIKSVAGKTQKLINCCQVAKVRRKRVTTKKKRTANVGFMQKLSQNTNVDFKYKGKVDIAKVQQYVAENPWNIQAAFRRYSAESGINVSTIHNLYYCRRKGGRIKDGKELFTNVGSKGRSTRNSKNTNKNFVLCNLWQKILGWLHS